MNKQIPRGLLSPSRDGLLDPEKITAAERHTQSVERLVEERERRTSPSPVIRRLQAATDAAFRKARR